VAGELPGNTKLEADLDKFTDEELLFLADFFMTFTGIERRWLAKNFPAFFGWSSWILAKTSERFISHVNTKFLEGRYSQETIKTASFCVQKTIDTTTPFEMARIITLVWATYSRMLVFSPEHGLPFISGMISEMENWIFSLCVKDATKAKVICEELEKIGYPSTGLLREVLRQKLGVTMDTLPEPNKDRYSVAKEGLIQILKSHKSADALFSSLTVFFSHTPLDLLNKDICLLAKASESLDEGENQKLEEATKAVSFIEKQMFGGISHELAELFLRHSKTILHAYKKVGKSRAAP
jgi:hypothetical protein